MSLISEALRKARQQATDRGEADSGPAAPPTVIKLRPRSPLGTGLVIGASIAVAAGLAGAAAVWWVLGGGDTGSTVTAAAVEQTTISAAGSLSSDPAPLDATLSGAGSTDPEHTPAAAPIGVSDHRPLAAGGAASREPAPAGSAAGDEARPATTVEQELDEVSSATPVALGLSRRVDRGDGDRVFVLDADLGYATLSLGYIIYRPDDPFAEINGSEVHEGSEIEGFVVERIERDRVVLRDDRGPLELRAR